MAQLVKDVIVDGMILIGIRVHMMIMVNTIFAIAQLLKIVKHVMMLLEKEIFVILSLMLKIATSMI